MSIPIAIVFPVSEFYYISETISEFNDDNFSVPLKRNGKIVALSASGGIGSQTFNKLTSDPRELERKGIHLYLLSTGYRVVGRTAHSPEILYFDLRSIAKLLDCIIGQSGLDTLIKTIMDFFGPKKPLPSMSGKITILNKEAVQ